MKINKPKRIPPHAAACLKALSDSGLGKHMSLGGAFGLSHYYEFRTTHDIDAWWNPKTTSKQRKAVVGLIETCLADYGRTRVRAWGDVVSIDLEVDEQVAFSFQIALRSAQLRPSLASPWKTLLLDSFDDLVASKMAALVERGAPRDFVDIFNLCKKGFLDPKLAWELWKSRQMLAEGDADTYRALLAVATHLQRIELHRPLDKIPSYRERRAAIALRVWFAKDFLHALMD